MIINIIPGARWGRRLGAQPIHALPTTARQHFLVHYDGGTPITRNGDAVPRAVDKEHHGNGWAGIGYNLLVDQAGNIYEGRGWNLVGAHCPNFNRNSIGVQVAIGGSQEPTQAAKAAIIALYAEASRLAGKNLAKSYHGEHFSTSCAGSNLIPWVKAGMPPERCSTTGAAGFSRVLGPCSYSSQARDEHVADRHRWRVGEGHNQSVAEGHGHAR